MPDLIEDEDQAKSYVQEHVSRETFDLLNAYVGQVDKWQRAINLFGRKEAARFWQRHMLDGYQLHQHLPQECHHVLDVGSGGGVPGVILAILRPDMKVNLVERDQRKCSFLRDCVRSLGLSNTQVVADDVFVIDPLGVDVVTARAFAGMTPLIACLIRHGSKNAQGIFLKGANWFQELPLALQQRPDLVHTIPSMTDSGAVILTINHADILGLEQELS